MSSVLGIGNGHGRYTGLYGGGWPNRRASGSAGRRAGQSCGNNIPCRGCPRCRQFAVFGAGALPFVQRIKIRLALRNGQITDKQPRARPKSKRKPRRPPFSSDTTRFSWCAGSQLSPAVKTLRRSVFTRRPAARRAFRVPSAAPFCPARKQKCRPLFRNRHFGALEGTRTPGLLIRRSKNA